MAKEQYKARQLVNLNQLKEFFINISHHTNEKECWLWIFNKDSGGYGQKSFKGKPYRIHVLSYMAFKDDYNSSLFVLHKCHIERCFNPEHLYQGTQKENIRDQVVEKTHVGMNKTHCKYGHLFNKENTRIDKKGHRTCKLCQYMRRIKKL